MKLIKKIPAFTLTEMLLVLAISAIVAGLAFSIISLFTKNIHTIQANYSNNTTLDLFENQLTVDFNHFHFIEYQSKTNTLAFKTPIDSIVYSFEETAILRDLDTIFNGNHSKKMYAEGNEIVNGIIDAIKINITDKKSNLFIFKENDAHSYIMTYGD